MFIFSNVDAIFCSNRNNPTIDMTDCRIVSIELDSAVYFFRNYKFLIKLKTQNPVYVFV